MQIKAAPQPPVKPSRTLPGRASGQASSLLAAGALALCGAVVSGQTPPGWPGATQSAFAQPAPSPQVFKIPENGVVFTTGDTWEQNGQTMRLYGVQSCLRGTPYNNAAGATLDCGEASLAYLAAIVRDTKPACAAIASVAKTSEIVVVCSAAVGGSTLDLGTILVSQGFAFAALDPDKTPVYAPYMIAEIMAHKARAGLWAQQSFTHPAGGLAAARQQHR